MSRGAFRERLRRVRFSEKLDTRIEALLRRKKSVDSAIDDEVSRQQPCGFKLQGLKRARLSIKDAIQRRRRELVVA